MTNSLLVAGPLMIAAIVTAFRFVGCGLDSDPIPGDPGDDNGDGDDKPKQITVTVNLTGKGTLTGNAAFPSHDPAVQQYDSAGSYVYAIPYWCTKIDLILLGAGGGGTYGGINNGVGGGAGQWATATLKRGSSDIPWATTTISVTVGLGGPGALLGGSDGTAGGDTTASWDTAPGNTATAPGGGAGASTTGLSGDGPNPAVQSVGDAMLTAGAAQPIPGAAGNAPGGGGAGSDVVSNGGNGADGAAIIVASQD
jgi:hypothetical protein